MSTDLKAVRAAIDEFEKALDALIAKLQEAKAYMPGFATRMRVYADDLAERFPDETNGGGDQ